MPDCLFCKIVSGEVPSTEVASSDETYAFRDANPALPVHVLVEPRRHITNAGDIRPQDGGVLAEMFNVGDDALNSVPHLHLHVRGGRRMGWPPG